jgi:hypothetical protein
VPPAPSSIPSFTAEAIERRAAELAAQHDFDRRCDEVAISGRTSFPDFDTQVGNLVRLVDRADPASNAAYANFLTAAMETGAAPQLLHDLGQNLNEASRILAMKPVAMGVALAKLASSADTQSPAASTGSVSGAPRPLTPVGGRGSNKELIHPDDTSRADSLSTAEWMARRADQIRARREASRKR